MSEPGVHARRGGAPSPSRSASSGPLVGADLMYLKDIETTEIGAVSIDGAGTFDGIVLSAIVAAYIA